MSIVFIPLSEAHRTGVMDIFNYYAENSYAAYPDKALPYERFDLFLEATKNYPAYAAIGDDGAIAGFFLLRSYNPMPAFRETAEFTSFFAKDVVGQGIGTQALRLLEDDARKHGIRNIVSNVVSRNVPSLAFHRKNGFTEAGQLREVGKKFGEYFDVVLFQKTIEPA
jgi:phosphinothricin acetyltransferase